MNITFQIAFDGLVKYAELLGPQGAAVGRNISAAIPQIESILVAQFGEAGRQKLHDILVDWYRGTIIGMLAPVIFAQRGVALPGYDAPVAAATIDIESLSDEEVLGIIRPLYRQFQEDASSQA